MYNQKLYDNTAKYRAKGLSDFYCALKLSFNSASYGTNLTCLTFTLLMSHVVGLCSDAGWILTENTSGSFTCLGDTFFLARLAFGETSGFLATNLVLTSNSLLDETGVVGVVSFEKSKSKLGSCLASDNPSVVKVNLDKIYVYYYIFVCYTSNYVNTVNPL